MPSINTCVGVGPYNTPINEADQLIFTESTHGFDYILEDATQWFEDVKEIWTWNQTSANLVEGSCNNDIANEGNQRYRLNRKYHVADTFGNIHPMYNYQNPTHGPSWFYNLILAEGSPFEELIGDGIWEWEKGVCECEPIVRCTYMCGSCGPGNTAINFDCSAGQTCGVFPCGTTDGSAHQTAEDWCEEQCMPTYTDFGSATLTNDDVATCALEWYDTWDFNPVSDGYHHLGFQYIGGCPDPSHPSQLYNPDVCYEATPPAYIELSCPPFDCNGDTWESCGDACSYHDGCNQCSCGEHVVNGILDQVDCLLPNELEDCYLDCLGEQDGLAVIDECGECSGGNSGYAENYLDLGCGCFEAGPQQYYLDKDMNCNLAYDLTPTNVECDVTESSFQSFCTIMGSTYSSNTCNPEFGFLPQYEGTVNCVVPYFNPYLWVDCSDPSAPCIMVTNDQPDAASGIPVPGCTDPNAIPCIDEPLYEEPLGCYNPNATYGPIHTLCEYEQPNGWVMLRHNFTKYLTGDYWIESSTDTMFRVECTSSSGTPLGDIQMHFHDSINSYHYFFLNATGHKAIKCKFYVMLDPEQKIYDNITHDIIIDEKLPTFIGLPDGTGVKYFYDYEGQFNDRGTLLPLITLNDQASSLDIKKGEIDELNNLSDESVNTFIINYDFEYTQLTGGDNDTYWEKSNYNITSTEDYQLESIGMDGINDWYLDSLSEDKTSIKNALVYDLWKQMDVGYTFDYRFIDLTINSDDVSMNEYRGTYLLREQLTPEILALPASDCNLDCLQDETNCHSPGYDDEDLNNIHEDDYEDYPSYVTEVGGLERSCQIEDVKNKSCDDDDKNCKLKIRCTGTSNPFTMDDVGTVVEVSLTAEALSDNTDFEDISGTWYVCANTDMDNDDFNLCCHPDSPDSPACSSACEGFAAPFITRWYFDNPIPIVGDWPGIENVIVDIPSFTRFMLLNELSLNIDGYNDFTTYSPDGITLYFILPDNFSNSFQSIESDRDNLINVHENDYTGMTLDIVSPTIVSTIFGTIGWNSVPMKTAWNELRGDIFTVENIHNKIDYYYNYLKKSMVMDNQRWNYRDTEIYETYKDTINYLKEWIENRINYMDKVYSFDCCNDPTAINYNSDCNYNAICEYYADKTIIFELNTTYVNHPPVIRVELEIIKKTVWNEDNESWELKIVNEKYDLQKLRDNLWSITLPVSTEFVIEAHTIEYHFIKHVQSVYTVESGAIEFDNSRFLVVGYEKEIVLSHYFNDFVDNFERTNLPIIKIDTINYNDMGWVNEHNPNLWYCPGYINDREIIDGWSCDDFDEGDCDSECLAQGDYVSAVTYDKFLYINEMNSKGTSHTNVTMTSGVIESQDWMEIFNPNHFDVNLKNYSFADKKYAPPDSDWVTLREDFWIPAKGYAIIVADDCDGDANWASDASNNIGGPNHCCDSDAADNPIAFFEGCIAHGQKYHEGVLQSDIDGKTTMGIQINNGINGTNLLYGVPVIRVEWSIGNNEKLYILDPDMKVVDMVDLTDFGCHDDGLAYGREWDGGPWPDCITYDENEICEDPGVCTADADINWGGTNGPSAALDSGYYLNKTSCEINTECTVDCMDGTNLWDEPKVSGWMDLIYDGEDTIHRKNGVPQLSTKIGIEARGFSSRGFSKKQYAIETQEAYAFPQCNDENANYNLFCNGFSPEEGVERNEDCLFTIENDFVLLGPYRDRTYIRNALTYELWNDMGNPSSNSKFVEFVLNDVYQGIFVVFEKPKADEYRMNVGEDGFIVKIESGGEQEYFTMYDGFTKVEYYDPDPADMSDSEKTAIQDKVIDASYDISMLDQKSFVDYMISQELAQNNEGYTRSQYWMMYQDDDTKFYQGYVWDMNHAYGAVIDYSSYWSFQEFFAVGEVWKDFIRNNEDAIYESWIDYRSNILDVNNLLERIDNISDTFKGYNAIGRDESRWFYSNSQSYDAEFTKFKGWLFSRIGFIDATMCDIDGEQFIINFDSVNTLSSFACSKSPNRDYCEERCIGNTTCEGFTTETVGWLGSNTRPPAGASASDFGYHHPDLQMTDCIFNDDFNKTFFIIISPQKHKVFDVSATKFIEFNWITSADLWILAYYQVDDRPVPYFPVEFRGEPSATFEIKDSISHDVVYSFVSTDLSGFTKFDIPSYVWNLSKYEDITGSYYIQGTYIYYEGDYEHIIRSNASYFSIEFNTEQRGCIDPFAINYNEFATVDDENCKYQTDCDEKYLIDRTNLQTVRTFEIFSGYNILSYPFPFTLEDVTFFEVLDASYTAYDAAGFSEFDAVTTHFEGKLYSATYINGNWKSTNSDGLNINNIEPGMGIILETSSRGIISWTLPDTGVY
tara:strand:+ start:1186 stop:8202 length:7017 start_codon:yes stop_codon:yes gene_type:complete